MATILTEWAIDPGDRIWLLQSRPLLVEAARA
jgi:hypothetical protein